MYGVAAFLIVVAVVFVGIIPPYLTTYECSGVMTEAPNTSGPVTLFVRIRQEGWWVLWRHWDAVALEIPSTTAPARTDVFLMQSVGWFLNLYRYRDGQIIDFTKMKVQGQFSNLSNSLTLKISDQETFRGACSPKNN
jgi:hypothetical protein